MAVINLSGEFSTIFSIQKLEQSHVDQNAVPLTLFPVTDLYSLLC